MSEIRDELDERALAPGEQLRLAFSKKGSRETRRRLRARLLRGYLVEIIIGVAFSLSPLAAFIVNSNLAFVLFVTASALFAGSLIVWASRIDRRRTERGRRGLP